MMMKPKIVLGGLLLLSLIFLGCLSSETGDDSTEKVKAIIYKSPSCGCCGEYGSFLRSKGFDVEVVNLPDVSDIKQQYGIPAGMQSCHTTIIEGYFVEGHVPMEAIEQLLAERPEIDGIALPGMPSGSPGMSGPQTQPFTVYSVDEGGISEFLVVD